MARIDDVFTWLPQLYGTNIGTGSGSKLKLLELNHTEQVFTGYELVEAFAAEMAPKAFKLKDLLTDLQGDLEAGSVIMLEHPTQQNQLGRFRFDPDHPINLHGAPPDAFSLVDVRK